MIADDMLTLEWTLCCYRETLIPPNWEIADRVHPLGWYVYNE